MPDAGLVILTLGEATSRRTETPADWPVRPARSCATAASVEDPVGIGTAFLQSGAGALLVSLWKVEDDATAELMQAFYKRWIEDGGESRVRALRVAKLALIAGHGGSAPRRWAPFVLIGPR